MQNIHIVCRVFKHLYGNDQIEAVIVRRKRPLQVVLEKVYPRRHGLRRDNIDGVDPLLGTGPLVDW